MLAHIDSSDPTGAHHWLPFIGIIFGTLGMYWVLGVAYVRRLFSRLAEFGKKVLEKYKHWDDTRPLG